MANDPAILFYTSDFLTGTITMTDEQRGQYIMLLCLQHQQGHLSEEDMLSICKKYDKKIFSKFIKDDNGLYFNKRMDIEVEKRKKYSESRRLNRITKKDSEDMNNICETHVAHMENENINIDIIEDKTKSNIKTKEQNFKTEVLSFKKYPVQMLNDFISYWTEQNKSKTKLRYELEKTWDTGRRLNTWAGNEGKFNKEHPKNKDQPVRKSSNFDRVVNDDARINKPVNINEILNNYKQ